MVVSKGYIEFRTPHFFLDFSNRHCIHSKIKKNIEKIQVNVNELFSPFQIPSKLSFKYISISGLKQHTMISYKFHSTQANGSK